MVQPSAAPVPPSAAALAAADSQGTTAAADLPSSAIAPRIGAVARWALAAAACLWLALCTAVGPLYWDWEHGSIANWNWLNTTLLLASFLVYFAIVWGLARYAAARPFLPNALRRRLPLRSSAQHNPDRAAGVSGASNPTVQDVPDQSAPAESLRRDRSAQPSQLNESPSDQPMRAPRPAQPDRGAQSERSGRPSLLFPLLSRVRTLLRRTPAFLDRCITRGTSSFRNIALILFVGWLWAPATLLAAFGADIRSQIREFSWAWNQWTGLKQPYIGFFSFVPMDIYPTAHYMWPDDPTYLTDQHNVVLTVFYGAAAAFSRYLTGSNDAGIVALAVLQMLFAVFCCAATAHRFLNLPWLNASSHHKAKTAPSPKNASPSGTTAWRQPAGGLARFLILLFFLCCPLAVFSTISLTKSPLFAFAFVWWFGIWYELVQTWRPALRKHMRRRNRRAAAGHAHDHGSIAPTIRLPKHSLIAFILSTSVMLVSAKYAWYIIMLQIVLAIIADRRRWGTYVAALLIPTVLIHGGIALAIDRGSIIGGDPIESRGLQLQMIARVAQRNPEGISAEAKKNLSAMFNLDQMADAYFQQDADPVKSSGIQAKKVSYKWRTVTSEDMTDFNKAWFQISRDNPVIALDAMLAKCFGYFNVADPPYVSMSYYVNSDYVQKNSVWIKSYNHDWRERVVAFASKWSSVPVLGWFTHGNFYVVLTLLLGAAEVIRRRWLSLMTHMPLLLLMGVMITAPANNFERHMLPVAFVFGFMALTFWRESQAERRAATPSPQY